MVDPMDEKAKGRGFENACELHHLVSQVDLSTPKKRAAFSKWIEEDGGTKEGLLELLIGTE
jgi:hypothetical protein